METDDELAELDGALARVAQRLAVSTDPVPHAARRIGRLEREPWMRLLWTGGIVGVLLATGSYVMAAGLTMALLPRRIDGVRSRRAELDGLTAEADLLELERTSVTKRLHRARTSVALYVVAGLGFSLLAMRAAHPIGFIGAGAVLLTLAAFLWTVVMPRLVRELRDLGGSPSSHKAGILFSMVFIVLLPFILLLMLYGAVRRMLGFPDPEWEEDDDENQDGDATLPDGDAKGADQDEEKAP